MTGFDFQVALVSRQRLFCIALCMQCRGKFNQFIKCHNRWAGQLMLGVKKYIMELNCIAMPVEKPVCRLCVSRR